MRSLVVLLVEHGETIDPLDSPISGLLARFDEAVRDTEGARFLNSTVRVDLPACFVLDS